MAVTYTKRRKLLLGKKIKRTDWKSMKEPSRLSWDFRSTVIRPFQIAEIIKPRFVL